MLLPQSPAFTTLKGRLAAVPEIGLLRLQLEGRKAERPPSGAPQIDFGQLLDAYRAVPPRSLFLRSSADFFSRRLRA